MKVRHTLYALVAVGCLTTIQGYSIGGGDNGPEMEQIEQNPNIPDPESAPPAAKKPMTPVNPPARPGSGFGKESTPREPPRTPHNTGSGSKY